MELNVLLFTFVILSLYGFMIYPIILLLVDINYSGRTMRSINPLCTGVTIVISVKNESSNIVNKLNNLFSLDINDLPFEIIVVSDGSEDCTHEILQKYPSTNLRVITSLVNNGKPVSLNTALSVAKYNRVLFADSRQTFDSQVIVELLEELNAPDVACVSGELFPMRSSTGVGSGVDLYWKIEKFIRRVESDLFSSIGCTGAIYAIKTSSYFPIPSDTLLDDVVIPMLALINGQKVKFRSSAMAYDYQSLNRISETRRKTRTIGGNYQMLFRYPEFLCNRQFLIGFFYFSHKISRLVSPFAMVASFILFFVLLPSLYLRFIFLIAMGCGLVVLKFINIGIFAKISGFLFLNLMVFKGLFYYLRGGYRKGW